MVGSLDTPRIVRIFVSSPGDVAAERARLEDVVGAINRTQARDHGIRYELHRWETDVVPQIGPPPQAVVDAQTPPGYDLYLGIMWGRFGTPTEGYGSGTEQELRQAVERWGGTGAPWILFYFRDDPPNVRTSDQARQYTKVLELREELSTRGIVGSYTGVDGGAESFSRKADEHLRLLLVQHFARPSTRPGMSPAVTVPANPAPYLQDLLERTAHIEIRGLATGEARAHRFPIDSLFVTLHALASGGDGVGARKPRGKEDTGEALSSSGPVPLETALAHRTLVVVGDPGSGKSTFLHRVAHALSRALLGIDPDALTSLGALKKTLFPILLRAEDLARWIAERQDARGASKPALRDSATWLPRFLGAHARESGWDLPKEFFLQKLKAGECLVMIDGLDEAPDRVARQDISRVIEAVAATYRECKVVVTSRPAAYSGDVVLSGFTHVRIEPFDDGGIRAFLDRWCEALFSGQRAQAARHREQLDTAVTGQLRRLARNPLILTAIAVLHWNERRLP